MKSLEGKHIVLGVTGGIAAYKSVMLLRLLIKEGAEVQVVMTPNAKEFVAPVTFSSLSGKPVVSEFFTANTGEWHSHVDLGLWSDLMVIAPATAATIGKLANGIADNMLVTTYLSAKSPVMIAPAMDLDMWIHPSTQRNMEVLKGDGVMTVAPGSGELASGLNGKGRMAEPSEILKAIKDFFAKGEELKGKRILVTSGPTYENLDPVRFIGNYSSGKMGFNLAEAFLRRGGEVFLITGPVSVEIPDHPRLHRIDVRSAREMLAATEPLFSDMDIAVFAAAVADYAPEEKADKKIKRENAETLSIKLRRNPDIAATLGKEKRGQITVGFALETDHELENAARKIQTKNLDLIVMNSLQDPEAGFMKDTNKVTIIDKEGEKTEFGVKSKREVAEDIVDTIIKYRFTVTKDQISNIQDQISKNKDKESV
ncbi:MAG: bifunctional phosphopantothenoylcysteine decarboxylase/phosphopantothenate--cysteine ligase CoaBC [Muribaculaceae bacterium]|nr:bifunctional phosphopantothenoylcysteine decarboxylase/phosphopantothenate--cysteine ligase CoaBC [Muribaculaceae bacterium]